AEAESGLRGPRHDRQEAFRPAQVRGRLVEGLRVEVDLVHEGPLLVELEGPAQSGKARVRESGNGACRRDPQTAIPREAGQAALVPERLLRLGDLAADRREPFRDRTERPGVLGEPL